MFGSRLSLPGAVPGRPVLPHGTMNWRPALRVVPVCALGLVPISSPLQAAGYIEPPAISAPAPAPAQPLARAVVEAAKPKQQSPAPAEPSPEISTNPAEQVAPAPGRAAPVATPSQVSRSQSPPPLSLAGRAAYEQAKVLREAVGKLMLERGSTSRDGLTNAALVEAHLIPSRMMSPDGTITPAAGTGVQVLPAGPLYSFTIRYSGMRPDDCYNLVDNVVGATVTHACSTGLLSLELTAPRDVVEAIARRPATPPPPPRAASLPELSRTAKAVYAQAKLLREAVDNLFGKDAEDYRGLSTSALVRARLLPPEMLAPGLEVTPAAGSAVRVEANRTGPGFHISFNGLRSDDCRALVANTVGAQVDDDCGTGSLTWIMRGTSSSRAN